MIPMIRGPLPPRSCLAGDFVAGGPNEVWLADITYIPTQEGFLYLAFILDIHSRRIAGWAMENHMSTELVVDAQKMAVWRRKPSPPDSFIIPSVAPSTRGSRLAGALRR